MKVLVTGSAGFLGREFVKYHVARGDTVVGVDNESATGHRWPEGIYSRRRVDAGDWFLSAPEQTFDLAYHFAAPVGGRLKIEGDPLFNADSLRLDSLFFRWAVGKVGCAIYPSSSAVYPVAEQTHEDGHRLNERDFQPDDNCWYVPDEMYGFTKLAGEVLAWKAAKYGLSTLVLRPFSGYGETQSLDYPVPSICRRAAKREDPLVVWGSGEQTRDFIHVDDIVGATAALLSEGHEGYRAVNLGSGKPVSFNAIARGAAAIVGYDPMIQNDPTKPEGVGRRYADPTQMLRVYKPQVTLEQGLRRIIEEVT